MPRPPHRSILAITLCLLCSVVLACSALLNFEECQSDEDCLADAICGSSGLCEDSTSPPTPPTECEGDVCPPDLELLAGPCDRFEGPQDEDDLFYIGVILQLSGTGAGFGRPMLNAIMLAQEDFNSITGVRGRRIGLIICDTQARDQRAREAAEHLRDVGVQAIIGLNSSQVMTIAPQVTIPSQMLLVSPSATATTISNLDDEGLVWRTAPSDAVQGEALGHLIKHTIEEVIAPQTEDPVKVALLVRSNDRYANGLSQAVTLMLPEEIVFGGSARFSARDYPNIGAGEAGDYSEIIAVIANEEIEPDAVVILGSAEAWEIAAGLDALFTTKTPIYFVADAVKNAEEAARAPASLEGRIWGTSPQNLGESDYAPYRNFRVTYQRTYGAENPDDFQFIANAFDALYVVALAASQGFQGTDLARGMTMLSDGQAFEPTPDQAQLALRQLQEGKSINLMGASGLLNFDAQGDPVASPIALWCFEEGRVPEKGIVLKDDAFTPLTCDNP